DAIVVIENVERHLDEGKDSIEATQLTMQEVGGALVAMALVLMAVFVPVAFMPGLSGVMFKQFAVCIAVSIALSAVCALSLSPAIASIVMAGKRIAKLNFILTFDQKFKEFTDWYMHLTHKFVYNKKLTTLTFLGLCFLTLILFKVIPTGFLPIEDQGVLLLQMNLPASASLSRTDALAKKIENIAKDVEGVERIMVFAGMRGTNTAFMVFELEDFDKRELNIFEKAIRAFKGQPTDLSASAIAGEINKGIAPFKEANIYVMQPPPISGLSINGGFEYQMLSKGDYSPQQLEKIATDFILSANTNEILSNVYTTYQSNMLQYFVDIDTSKALAQGVSLSDIYTTLSANYG
ncbi:MAG: efflux RND transporter permease subunit, partial [Clostridia bacterium]|nr:efflux RND transporter permease subunit [Clostridia bacterium]